MWSTVELREIRVFLALCDELHFGRTAERMHVTPSRVSQIIRGLEAKLGGQLVRRTSRTVALTPLGERFRTRVGGLHADLAQALEETRAETQRLEETLRLGVFSAPAGGPHLKAIIDAFEARFPACKVETSEAVLDDVLGPLRRGETALMATWLPSAELDVVVGPTLNEEQRVLLVAPDHLLATRASASLEDLADYRVPRFERMPREFRELWAPATTPSGRAIRGARIDMIHRDFSQVGLRIARGEFVYPTVPSAVPLFAAGIELASVPIVDMPPLRSALIWPRRPVDAMVREFARVAGEILSARASGPLPVSEAADAQR